MMGLTSIFILNPNLSSVALFSACGKINFSLHTLNKVFNLVGWLV